MARRLTRKQIKHDDFITLFDTLMHWLVQNWRQAATGFGGALLVGLVWWGVTGLLGSRSDAAAAALSSAVETYDAPVGSAATADVQVKFNTDAERLDAAEKAFQRVVSSYWLTPQVKLAKLYLARIATDRGDLAGAIRQLTALSDRHSADPVVRLAMLDLIRLRIAKGEGQQLVGELEAMAAGKDPRLPRDVALFELARVWERAGKPEEADKMYRKIVQDFPESPYVYEAKQRLAAAG